MMNKTKKWRRRGDDEDDEATTITTALKEKKPQKSETGKQASGVKLLSFAEDEEIPVKTKKKSSALLSFAANEINTIGQQKSKKKSGFGTSHGSTHKLGAGKEKGQGLPSNVQPQAGEYTKERLLELQRKTNRLGGVRPPIESKPAEPIIVLKGLLKPVADPEKDEQVEAVPADGLANMDIDGEAQQEFERLGIGGVSEAGGSTQIYDAAVIAAAKAERERIRQAHAVPDYIPLGSGDGDLRSKLRDIPEEDVQKGEVVSSDDEGDHQGRLAFLGDKKGANKAGVFESVDRNLSVCPRDDEEEDEERKWEEEQLRKGAGKRVDEASLRVASGAPAQALPYAAASSGVPLRVWEHSLETLSVNDQAESVMKSLRSSMKRVQESQEKIKSELYRNDQNMSSSLSSIDSFEKSLCTAEEKYIYMQKLRDYISVLCEFLQSKGPLIEELEEHMQRLHEERANAIIERRVADNADEMVEVQAAVTAAAAVINRGGGNAAATGAAIAAAAAVRETTDSEPQLDEYGRDINLQKRAEKKRRAEARQQRRLAKSVAVNGFSEKVEGESSSDESESEENGYAAGRSDVLETADRIFSDASEDFSQLAIVKSKLEDWKKQYGGAYRDSYMSMSAPAIFAPYVRLELLKWDPLYQDSGFGAMNWHSLLFDYGMSQENGNALENGDMDADLVPNLVEKVALPLLHHKLEHCWNRLSTNGTKNAVAAVQEILVYVPASSVALQELLASVRLGLREAVSQIEVPSWNWQLTGAVAEAAAVAAHRFGASTRLLQNIGMWKEVLAANVVDELALDELLCGKMLPHLRMLLPKLDDVVRRTERVVCALSGVWIGKGIKVMSPKLRPLIEHVLKLARGVEKRDGGGGEVGERVRRMLNDLNEHERARQLQILYK